MGDLLLVEVNPEAWPLWDVQFEIAVEERLFEQFLSEKQGTEQFRAPVQARECGE
jgi:hypothetical protein